MSFFDTEIENLTYDNIESLVTDTIPESSSLEYKSEMIESIYLKIDSNIGDQLSYFL